MYKIMVYTFKILLHDATEHKSPTASQSRSYHFSSVGEDYDNSDHISGAYKLTG